MRVFRVTRAVVLGGLCAISLSLNVATVAFNSVAVLVSGAYEAVTGAASVVGGLRRDADNKTKRIASMSDDLGAKDRRIASMSDDLASKDRRIVTLTDDLASKDRRIASLSEDVARRNKQVAGLTDEVTGLRQAKTVTYRKKPWLVGEAVQDTTNRVSRRIATAAARSAGSVAAEAIPVAGVAVILGVTAWELKDACATMKDLRELDLAFNPDTALDPEVSEVCGRTVPSGEEVWQTVKASPGKAWASAREHLPDLPEFHMPDIHWPDIDWTFWD